MIRFQLQRSLVFYRLSWFPSLENSTQFFLQTELFNYSYFWFSVCLRFLTLKKRPILLFFHSYYKEKLEWKYSRIFQRSRLIPSSNSFFTFPFFLFIYLGASFAILVGIIKQVVLIFFYLLKSLSYRYFRREQEISKPENRVR